MTNLVLEVLSRQILFKKVNTFSWLNIYDQLRNFMRSIL